MYHERIVRGAFKLWYKDPASKKYFIFLLVLPFVWSLVSSAITFALNLIFEPGLAIGVLLNVIVVFTLFVVYLFAFLYIFASLIISALHVLNFKTAGFGFIKLIKLIFLTIGMIIVGAISWHNKKHFFLFLALAIFSIIGLVLIFFGSGVGSFILSFVGLGWGIYLFIVLYNYYIRLSLTWTIFLHKEIGMLAAIKESWNLTGKNTLGIFISYVSVYALLLLGLLILYSQFIVLIFGTFSSLFGSILTSVLMGGFDLLSLAPSLIFLAMFIILMIIFYLYAMSIQVIYAYLGPLIYADLLEEEAPGPSAASKSQSEKPEEKNLFSRPGKISSKEDSVPPVRSSSISTLSQKEEKEVATLVNILKDDSKKFTDKQIRQVISEKSYAQNVANETIRRLKEV